MTKLFATLFSASFLLACGGSQKPAETPEGGVDEAAADAAPAVDNEAAAEAADAEAADVEAADDAEPADEGGEEATAPGDGIVRDADGDGVPDEAGGGCGAKTETQCKISSGCAWSEAGKCVESGGM